MIGGAHAADRNVISGNNGDGIWDRAAQTANLIRATTSAPTRPACSRSPMPKTESGSTAAPAILSAGRSRPTRQRDRRERLVGRRPVRRWLEPRHPGELDRPQRQRRRARQPPQRRPDPRRDWNPGRRHGGRRGQRDRQQRSERPFNWAGVAINSGSSHSVLGNLDLQQQRARDRASGARKVPVTTPGRRDPDANGVQNFPVLTGRGDGGRTDHHHRDSQRRGRAYFLVEFFASASPGDASGHGEGGRYLGAVRTLTWAGNASSSRPRSPLQCCQASAIGATRRTSPR